jgi:hypothetical protein
MSPQALPHLPDSRRARLRAPAVRSLHATHRAGHAPGAAPPSADSRPLHSNCTQKDTTMKASTARPAMMLAIALALAALAGCSARGDTGSTAVAVQSATGDGAQEGAAQSADAQSPYSIPF